MDGYDPDAQRRGDLTFTLESYEPSRHDGADIKYDYSIGSIQEVEVEFLIEDTAVGYEREVDLEREYAFESPSPEMGVVTSELVGVEIASPNIYTDYEREVDLEREYAFSSPDVGVNTEIYEYLTYTFTIEESAIGIEMIPLVTVPFVIEDTAVGYEREVDLDREYAFGSPSPEMAMESFEVVEVDFYSEGVYIPAPVSIVELVRCKPVMIGDSGVSVDTYEYTPLEFYIEESATLDFHMYEYITTPFSIGDTGVGYTREVDLEREMSFSSAPMGIDSEIYEYIVVEMDSPPLGVDYEREVDLVRPYPFYIGGASASLVTQNAVGLYKEPGWGEWNPVFVLYREPGDDEWESLEVADQVDGEWKSYPHRQD